MAHTRRFPKFVLLVGLFAVLACWGLCVPSPSAEVEIIILCSHWAAPYEQAIEGFKASMASGGIRANIQLTRLDGDKEKADAALQQLQKARPTLVLTLGSLATQAVRSLNDVPTVAGLILNADEIGGRMNAGGVILDFPMELQFEWLMKILPEAHRVGALFSGGKNSRKIDEAIRVTQKLGLKLQAKQVATPSEIPDALEGLAKQVDVIWGIPDDMVYTPQTAKHILLFSFRSSIPVIGPSDAWVKAGALYALGWDYRDLGAQCGELAMGILKGNPPEPARSHWPRSVRLSINKKTAVKLNIKLPESILRGSELIHE